MNFVRLVEVRVTAITHVDLSALKWVLMGCMAPTNGLWARSLGPTGLLRESRFTIEGGGDDMILDDEESKQRIYSPLVPAKPVAQPTLPSMPLVRRQVTLSSCEIKGYTCSKCPTRVQ